MTDAIGTVTMYPKLERREWIFGTAPDPRDARIAELEAALREIVDGCSIQDAWITAYRALYPFPAPERDMVASVEEWDA